MMVKKLRYYARFIVVCLLLKKMKLVRELVIELERQIQEYTSTYAPASPPNMSSFQLKISPFSYEPEDALEWALVLDEIKGFIKADAAVSVLHADSNPIVLSHRYAHVPVTPESLSSLFVVTFGFLVHNFHNFVSKLIFGFC